MSAARSMVREGATERASSRKAPRRSTIRQRLSQGSRSPLRAVARFSSDLPLVGLASLTEMIEAQHFYEERLCELIGHTPFDVAVGALTAISLR